MTPEERLLRYTRYVLDGTWEPSVGDKVEVVYPAASLGYRCVIRSIKRGATVSNTGLSHKLEAYWPEDASGKRISLAHVGSMKLLHPED